MTGCPYRAKMTSPCSVTLNRPFDRAGRLGQHRPAGRAAAAPERPAPAVEEGQPHVVAGRPTRPARAWASYSAQGGADRAELLGRVGVAEHDLELTAAGRAAAPQPARSAEHLVQHRGSVLQILPALEQRDDVEHRRLTGAGGVPGQPYTAAMSAPERVKLTTYRRHASTPNRPWIHATARKVASTSGRSGPTAAAARLRSRPGRGRAPRVLADLQPGQVEPERLRLPDQVLQLAGRLPGRAGRGQRVAAPAAGRRGTRAARVGQVGVPQPGRAQPLVPA